MALPASTILDQENHIHDNKQPFIITASAIRLPLAYIAVILRFAARRLARHSLKADDYTVLLALFFTSLFVTMVLIGVHYGAGRHWILVTNGIAYAKIGLLQPAVARSPSDLFRPIVYFCCHDTLQLGYCVHQMRDPALISSHLSSSKSCHCSLVRWGLCCSIQHNRSYGEPTTMFAHPRGLGIQPAATQMRQRRRRTHHSQFY